VKVVLRGDDAGCSEDSEESWLMSITSDGGCLWAEEEGEKEGRRGFANEGPRWTEEYEEGRFASLPVALRMNSDDGLSDTWWLLETGLWRPEREEDEEDKEEEDRAAAEYEEKEEVLLAELLLAELR
jgi:hypothetical protein